MRTPQRTSALQRRVAYTLVAFAVAAVRRGWLGLPGPADAMRRCPAPRLGPMVEGSAVRSMVGAVFWTRLAASEHEAGERGLALADLMRSLGAPGSLVLRMRNAGVAKRHQARPAFGLAHSFAGVTVAPAANAGAAPMPRDLRALVAELVIEGCVGQGFAARYAELAAWMCVRAPLSDTWALIATQEARHCDHAWAVIEWLRQAEPAGTNAALRQQLERLASLAIPRSIPWWLDTRLRRPVGILPRHSELELFEVQRSQVQARLESMVRRAGHSSRDVWISPAASQF